MIALVPRCQRQHIRRGRTLAARGVRTAIWGDMLLQGVRGKEPRVHRTRSGYQYRAPRGMSPEQVRKLIPKDILIFNWFWSGRGGNAETNEAQLEEFGFRQIYGNMEPTVPDFERRARRSTIIGGAPSSRATTTEFNFGKDMLWSIMSSGSMLWTGRAMESRALSEAVQARMRETRRRLAEEPAPSETDRMSPIVISKAFNAGPVEPVMKLDLSGMKQGELHEGSMVFDLRESGGRSMVIADTEGTQPNPRPREAAYEDGFVQSVPVRYGVNILEWNWGEGKTRAGGANYCYADDLLRLGDESHSPVTFFAYEWKSPRLGKVIKEVRLKGTTKFRGAVPGFEDRWRRDPEQCGDPEGDQLCKAAVAARQQSRP